MDITKWNLDEAKIAWWMEGFEEGLEAGREKAREKARLEGREEAFEEYLKIARASDEEMINIAAARNALAKGSTLEFVQEITGLDIDAIRNIQALPVSSE